MSAYVLLNLSNKVRKSDKVQGLPSILSLFHNEFNKFNRNVGLYFSHDLKLLLNCMVVCFFRYYFLA